MSDIGLPLPANGQPLTGPQQTERAQNVTVINLKTPEDTIMTLAQAKGALDPTIVITPELLATLEIDTPQIYKPPIKRVPSPTSATPIPTYTLAGFFSSAMATVSIAMNNLASLLAKIQAQMQLQSASLTPQLVQAAHDAGDAAKDRDDMQAYEELGNLVASATGLVVAVGSLGVGIAKGAFGANEQASQQGLNIISTGRDLSQSITSMGSSAPKIWTSERKGEDDLKSALAQNTQSITSKVQDQLAQAAGEISHALQEIFAQLRAQADSNASRGIFQGV